MSKCRVCREPAIIDLPRHNAHFCAEHLQQLCRRQVALLADTRRAVVDSLGRCNRCGSPTAAAGPGGAEDGPDELCAFCRLVEVASAHEPVPVEMLRPASARR